MVVEEGGGRRGRGHGDISMTPCDRLLSSLTTLLSCCCCPSDADSQRFQPEIADAMDW